MRQKLKEYNRIAGISEIARRYFAINSFDGIMTILGVLVGNYVASVQDPTIIISTGVATSVAMAVSGMWGSYLAEDAERKKKLHDLGKATLRNLKKTKLARAEKTAAILVSVVNGLAPSITALIVLIPFFLTAWMTIETAYRVSLALTFVMLFGLGIFLGKVSKEHVLLHGVKMLVIGILTISLIFLVGSPL